MWLSLLKPMGRGQGQGGRVSLVGAYGHGLWASQAVGKSLEPQLVAREGPGTEQHSFTAHMVPTFLQVPPKEKMGR